MGSYDWKNLVSAILEAGPQLKDRTWWREETGALEQWGRARGHEIFQDEINGENQYADFQRQCMLGDNNQILCHIQDLNASDRLEELGKRTESFTKIIYVLIVIVDSNWIY